METTKFGPFARLSEFYNRGFRHRVRVGGCLLSIATALLVGSSLRVGGLRAQDRPDDRPPFTTVRQPDADPSASLVRVGNKYINWRNVAYISVENRPKAKGLEVHFAGENNGVFLWIGGEESEAMLSWLRAASFIVTPAPGDPSPAPAPPEAAPAGPVPAPSP